MGHMKRLAEIEAERQAELRLAQRFAEKQGVGSLPGRRSETGESATAQRVGHTSNSTDESAREGDGLARKHRDALSYSGFESMEAWEDWLLDSGQQYTPLVSGVGGHPTMDTLEKRSRMNHVFSFMDPKRVELLYWRHIEGMTLGEIAEQESVSRQAITKRLRVAEAEFKASFADHWNDDITWEV